MHIWAVNIKVDPEVEKRGKPKKTWLYAILEDMKEKGVEIENMEEVNKH